LKAGQHEPGRHQCDIAGERDCAGIPTADVVVSLAGYNTVCELLSYAHRAILVPRAEPVQEQLIRARLLAAKGYFDLIEPEDLKPDVLMARVLSALKPTPTVVPPLDLDGLPRIAQRTAALLEQEYV